MESFDELKSIVARLRAEDGCPWDREQTHASLKPECIDTCSTLGICAERNAIFHMITNGEAEIQKVIAILPDGSSGAPCGACRELMVQLMPEKYKGVQIMMDYEAESVVTLGELTPAWWI